MITKIHDYYTGKEIRALTPDEIELYQSLIDEAGGTLDGRLFGYDGLVYGL